MTALGHALTHPALFSRHFIGIPLHRYQERPLTAVLQSILHKRGDEFLIVMPRQSGKNEALAHLQVLLLNLFQRKGGQIVFGAIGDGIGRGKSRLEDRLDNPLNSETWGKGTKPIRRTLGKAAVAFLSSHPSANSRGETAHILLIIDELQDQSAPHIEQVFEPMRAANNATAVYIGTVRLKSDALWQKKEELERLEQQDGIQRVFFVYPDDVIAENPDYSQFLQAKVAKFGRNHPIVAAEYFLEPIDADGGLFPPRRIALMQGQHTRQRTPEAGKSYVVLIDVGGQDEAATNAIAQLENPARDYTTATAIEVDTTTGDGNQPHYKAVDVLMLHGRRHFESSPGNPSAADQLLAFIKHWGASHTVIDATGIGEGMQSWLAARLPNRVTGFKFTGQSKAALGSAFISIIENGRFHYWLSTQKWDDADWFFIQAAACGYTIRQGDDITKGMSWSVPASHKTDTPNGRLLTHDDRLLSAALVAHADELILNGAILLGAAVSAIIPPQDPLSKLDF